MDIRTFLAARFAEEHADATAAQQADPAPWRANTDDTRSAGERPGHGFGLVIAADDTALWDCEGSSTLCMTAATARHVARWDPARVLAEIAAKRAILAEFPRSLFLDMTEQQLHEHRAHPAYEYATTQGQRKAWDDADVPPEGEGWERNVDAGRPGEGWDRFDYHEESYWRRLAPGGPQPPYVPRVLRLLAAPYNAHPDYNPDWS